MASKKKDYTVVGNHNVMGHAPGESFSASMTDELEEQLIESGHIKPGKVAE